MEGDQYGDDPEGDLDMVSARKLRLRSGFAPSKS
jgi:hypothetical protein